MLTYEIQPPSRFFGINTRTGAISIIQPLANDIEKAKEYRVCLLLCTKTVKIPDNEELDANVKYFYLSSKFMREMEETQARVEML